MLWLRESRQKKIKHQVRRLPKIEPELKLSKIFWKVLAGNPNVRPANAALQLSPEAFNGVGMSIAAYPLLGRVIHRFWLAGYSDS